jgi:hypothetical protein
MNQDNMNSPEEFLKLVYGHLDGTLSPEDAARLDQILSSNPEAADAFVKCAYSEGLVELHFSHDRVESEAIKVLEMLGLPIHVESDSVSAVSGATDDIPSICSLDCSTPLVPDVTKTVDLLNSDSASSGMSGNSSHEFPGSRIPGFGVWGAGLTFLALFIALWAVFVRNNNKEIAVVDTTGLAKVASPKIAKITSSIDALWDGQAMPDSAGWLPSGMVKLTRGQAEIQFSSGAMASIKATPDSPAEFQAVSPTQIQFNRGSARFLAKDLTTAFTVTTPTATADDKGTEFGISVESTGETKCAVFEGTVDLSSDTQSMSTQRRLTAGEALQVRLDGQFHRVTTVTDDSFPAFKPADKANVSESAPLITEVSDNLRSDDSPMFYRIVSRGFGEHAPAYVDRNYEWNSLDDKGISPVLHGRDYIMAFNGDKSKDIEITVGLSRSATVYVLFDDRGVLPNWLKEGFVKTDMVVGMDEDTYTIAKSKQLKQLTAEIKTEKLTKVYKKVKFSVWKKVVGEPGATTPTEVTLGSRGGAIGSRSMYGIVVVPLDEDKAMSEVND